MDNNNKKNKGGMPNRFAIIIILIVSLIIWYMISLLSDQVKESTNIEVTYDEFIDMVETGKLKSVDFKADRITFVPIDQPNSAFNITYYTGNIRDDNLLEKLDAANIKYKGEVPDNRSSILDTILQLVLI
jgi:cell division protease FtsH